MYLWISRSRRDLCFVQVGDVFAAGRIRAIGGEVVPRLDVVRRRADVTDVVSKGRVSKVRRRRG
jgi:hypothetical protein